MVVIALDLPAFFTLRHAGVNTAFLPPFAGRHLGPWCVERWRMPAWRSSHYAKASAALAASRIGVHAAVTDLDVFFLDNGGSVVGTVGHPTHLG